MNKENQVSAIKKFISSDEDIILINQVNDDIALFYLSIIRYFADNQIIKVYINDNSDHETTEDDLFGTKRIQIFNITNIKKLDAALDGHSKKIIFTDYKNYKRLNSKINCINGYQFENDITFFIRNELKITNEELLHYCKKNTALLFSETSKYLINNKYSSDRFIVDEKKFILNVRKSILKSKEIILILSICIKILKKKQSIKNLVF